ncbi:MAG: nucleotidyl transferase AbiEii/AbiGii toxin family protein [Planctomycetota bacterium]
MAFGLMAVLAGMSRVPACREHVVLKGGTALRLFLGRSIGRVSTDIDLSLLDTTHPVPIDVFTGDVRRETTNAIAEVFSDPAEIDIQLLEDRTTPPYPETPKMVKFRLSARYQKTLANRSLFLAELTLDEYVDQHLTKIIERDLYGLRVSLRAYAPVQAIAEKLRAILQKHQHFDRNGNLGNFEPRHVLDLVPLSELLEAGDLELLKPLFHRKCDARLVTPAERTRARLMNPHLHSAVEQECQRQGIAPVAWERLRKFAELVCDS